MEQITEIQISKIKPNPKQPRKEFDKEKLAELSASIKSNGLINPIQVKAIKGGKFELVCGERRLKAHQLNKLKKIQAIVKNYNSQQDEMVESLIENLHRADLNCIEKENFITKLWDTGKYKNHEGLGKSIGVSRTIITNNVASKNIRDKIKPSKTITTRVIIDTYPAPKLEDKSKILKLVETGKLLKSQVREYSAVISKSPEDVKQALLSEKISIQQASNISKIKNENVRAKLIQTHKEIKAIDNSVDRKVIAVESKKVKPIELIKINETIKKFRRSSLEHQKTLQTTIQDLKFCLGYINLMDEPQLKRLTHFHELFETNLDNVLDISNTIKQRIAN